MYIFFLTGLLHYHLEMEGVVAKHMEDIFSLGSKNEAGGEQLLDRTPHPMIRKYDLRTLRMASWFQLRQRVHLKTEQASEE